MTVSDLIARLRKLPALAEIQALERVVRDDGGEITVLLLAQRKRADGSIGPEYMHASLGGFNGMWSATQEYDNVGGFDALVEELTMLRAQAPKGEAEC